MYSFRCSVKMMMLLLNVETGNSVMAVHRLHKEHLAIYVRLQKQLFLIEAGKEEILSSRTMMNRYFLNREEKNKEMMNST